MKRSSDRNSRGAAAPRPSRPAGKTGNDRDRGRAPAQRGARAAVEGIAALKQGGLAVRSLQELGARIPRAALSPSPDAASLPVRAE